MHELQRHLLMLEKNGIAVDDNFHLKVGLFDISTDNLGANILFGFAGSFNSECFCRFCTCSKPETKTMITEDISKRRTVLQYIEQINKLDANSCSNLKDTKGIRRTCPLNQLAHFHIISNPSIDIMHDVNEGERFLSSCYISFVIVSLIKLRMSPI